MSCTNNIKNISLACHNHADINSGNLPAGSRFGNNYLTWITFILPYIEQQARYDSMSLLYCTNAAANNGFGGYNHSHPGGNNGQMGGSHQLTQNGDAWKDAPSVFICPSNAVEGPYKSGGVNYPFTKKLSYVAAGGSTAVSFSITSALSNTASVQHSWLKDYYALNGAGGDTSDKVSTHSAFFGVKLLYGSTQTQMNELGFGQVALSDAADGLSNTVLFSEVIAVPHDKSVNANISDVRGGAYDGRGAFFTTYYEPNTIVADEIWLPTSCHPIPKCPCVGISSTNNTTLGQRLSARSYHAGGVNASAGDGSVHFILDSISRKVWRSLGDASDGDAVSLP